MIVVMVLVLDDWMFRGWMVIGDGRTLPPERYDSRQAKQQQNHIVCPSLFFDGYEWCAALLDYLLLLDTIHSQ